MTKICNLVKWVDEVLTKIEDIVLKINEKVL